MIEKLQAMFFPTREIKSYNVMTHGRNVFHEPIKNDQIPYHKIRKIATGHRDDYATGYLPNYPYFKEHYKLTAIDLST